MDYEALIREVYQRRPLWDNAHPHHHHRGVLDKSWTEVSKRLKVTVKDARYRWKYLRDQYRREMRKQTPASSHQPTWTYFHLLHFLKDQIAPKEAANNSPQPSEDFPPQDCLIKIEHHDVDSSDFEIPSQEETDSPMNLKQHKTQEKEETSDDYHFFMSLLPMMRKFNDLQKMRIRNKFQQTILEELSQMEEYRKTPTASSVGERPRD